MNLIAAFENQQALDQAVFPSGLNIGTSTEGMDGRVAIKYDFVQMDIEYLESLGNVYLGEDFPSDWQFPTIEP